MINSSALKWGLCVAVAVVCGCAPAKVTYQASSELERHRMATIAVLPFEVLKTPQYLPTAQAEVPVPEGARRSDISFSIPPSGQPREKEVTVSVPLLAAEKVTGLVLAKVQNREGVRWVRPEEAAAVVRSLGSPERGVTAEKQAWQVASRLGADAALIGRVLVYQERGGSKYGGSPAEVGFEVRLIGPDGVTLWSGNYYERQRPFVEDAIGAFQRGFVFVTADELAEYGAKQIAKQLPVGTPGSR
ncbi:MAG: hypothetical protein HZB35_00110 [Nitrospirae bacterium]|nr:hypothetical protein [Nitrospirota bacterium]